ncbi:hypothetical protein M422DRAFT_42414 [Sphaerobolus stellatus SS14]|nr:hypothetical protein M422DRAFT_42414 [Sphaerobolus stellatus SS14]
MSTTLSPEASSFKLEGNNFYGKESYEEVIEKYTVAIELEPRNVVLFANREACYISSKSYLQATEIDPKYPKDWTRLGACYESLDRKGDALMVFNHAINCWELAELFSGPQKKFRANIWDSLRRLETAQKAKFATLKNRPVDAA